MKLVMIALALSFSFSSCAAEASSPSLFETFSDVRIGATLTSDEERADLQNEAHSVVLAAPIDFSALSSAVSAALDTHRSFGELIAYLESSSRVTTSEASSIRAFLKDRGVLDQTSLQKSAEIQDVLTSTLHRAIELASSEEAFELKMDEVFGEAYLAFDKRSARARVLDLLVPAAQATESQSLIGPRATAAMAAVIFASKMKTSH